MKPMTSRSEDFIPTRYSLLSRLQDWDDQDSWKDFFDTYWRLIYSIALKSGLTAAEAEDVVQETIISVAKNIQKFKRDRTLGSFKGWLRNLTRWRIRRAEGSPSPPVRCSPISQGQRPGSYQHGATPHVTVKIPTSANGAAHSFGPVGICGCTPRVHGTGFQPL
jgi:hypothetical protein